MRRARSVVPLLLVALGVLAETTPVTVSWRLRPSDFLRYERRTVTEKDGKEKFSGAKMVTVHGHDLRSKGQYIPVYPVRDDLPNILAFRLPPPSDEVPIKIKWRLKLRDTVVLRLSGTFEIHPRKDGKADVVAHYRFHSRGAEQKGDVFHLKAGKAHVHAVFDRTKRRIESSRVKIGFVRKRLNPKGKQKPQEIVARTYDLRFKSYKPTRYKGFQKDVDTAIDLGTKRLKERQKEDGSFPPHGNHEIGTTSLALLTLAACGVPRTDPVMEKGLLWLFTKMPRRTYDRALALMAVEEAYTPPGEAYAARLRKITQFKRDVPPDRLAWCRQIAASIEGSDTSPGSWGYPSRATKLSPGFDSSNTQYAVLGLRAAARMGIEVRDQTWIGVIRHFKRVMESSGKKGRVSIVREGAAIVDEGRSVARGLVPVPVVAGFRYNPRWAYAWSSMTCAGIASLAIARDQLRRAGRVSAALDGEIDRLILGGWAWLDRRWGMDRHPGHPHNRWYYYYLYSIERAGILDSVKRVGGKDWYFEGAVQLLERQNKNGGWPRSNGNSMTQTCFSLLFLKRATAPLTRGG